MQLPVSLKTELQFGGLLNIFMLQKAKDFSVGTNENVSTLLSNSDDLPATIPENNGLHSALHTSAK